jgi:hypothetical protein
MSMIFVEYHFVPHSPTWPFPHRQGRFQMLLCSGNGNQTLSRQSSIDHFLAVAKEAILIHNANSVIQVSSMGINKGIYAVGLGYVEKQNLILRLLPDVPSASLD